jgi:hypothetical protein
MAEMPAGIQIEGIRDNDIEAYAGDIESNYWDTAEYGDSDAVGDSSSISDSNNDGSGNTNQTDDAQDDSSNYLNNTKNGSSSSGSVGTGEKIENIANDVDSYLDGIEDEFSNFDNFYEELTENGEETGFWVYKGDVTEAIFRKLTAYFNTAMIVAMFIDGKSEALRRTADTFSDTPPDENQAKKTSAAKATGDIQNAMMKNFNKARMLVFQKIQAHNDAELQERLDAAEAYDDSTNTAVLVFTSGKIDGNEKKRMEMKEEAHRLYEAAMEESLKYLDNSCDNAFQGMEAGGLDLQEIGDDIFRQLESSEQYAVYDSNGYIDTNRTKAWLMEMREMLAGLEIAKKICVMSQVTIEEALKIAWEGITQKDEGTAKSKAAESAAGSEGGRTLGVFDSYASTLLQAQKHFNEAKFLEYQIQKWEKSYGWQVASAVFSWLGTALSIVGAAVGGYVGAILMAVGLVLSILSAVLSWAGWKIADSEVDDEYNPSTPAELGTYYNRGPDVRDQFRNSYISAVEDLENEQAQLQRNIDGSVLTKIDDGFYSMEFGEIAALNRELAGINAGVRFVLLLQRSLARALRGARRPFTKGRSMSNSLLELSACEVSLAQDTLELQTLVSFYEEVKTALNWERQQEIMMEKADFQLTCSLVGAVLGSIVGGFFGGSGALLGASLGQALGSTLAGFINAYWGAWFKRENTSRGVDFSPDVSDFDQAYRQGESGDLSRNMDLDINEIYSNIIDFDQSMSSAGHGTFGYEYAGVNADHLSKLQRQLNALHNTFLFMISSIESKSKALANTARACGISAASIDPEDLISMVKGKIASDNATFGYLTRLVAEKVEVHNRATAANEEVCSAAVKMAISVVVSAAGLALGGTVSKVFTSLITPVMSLLNSVFDVINAALNAQGGYGEFEQYIEPNKKGKEEDCRGRFNGEEEEDAIRAAEKLDNMLAELTALNNSYITGVGFGNWGVNMGMVAAQNQIVIKQIYMALEILTSREKKSSKARSRITGQMSLDSSALNKIAEVNEQAALKILNTQVQALQTVVQSHNRMNRAKRDAYKAAFQVAIDTAILLIQIARIKKVQQMKKIQNDMRKDLKNLNPTSKANLKKLMSSLKTLAWVSAALQMVKAVSSYIIGLIYDACQDSTEVDTDAARDKVEECERNEGRADNFVDKMDAYEQTTNALTAYSGELKTEIQGMSWGPPRNEEAARAFESAGRALKNAVEDLADLYRSNDKLHVFVKLQEKKKQRLGNPAAKPNPQSAAHAAGIQAPPPQNTKGQRERVDKLLKESMQRIAKESRTSSASITKKDVNRVLKQSGWTKDGEDLEKIKNDPAKLQKAYEKMYKKVYIPLREKMRKLFSERVKLKKQLTDINKSNLTPKEKAKKTAEIQQKLQACMQSIQQVKQEIKIYHAVVGKIASYMRKLKKELKCVDPKTMSVKCKVEPKATSKPAQAPKVQMAVVPKANTNKPAPRANANPEAGTAVRKIYSRIRGWVKRARGWWKRMMDSPKVAPQGKSSQPAVTPPLTPPPKQSSSSRSQALLARCDSLKQQVNQASVKVSAAAKDLDNALALVNLEKSKGRSTKDLKEALKVAKQKHQVTIKEYNKAVHVLRDAAALSSKVKATLGKVEGEIEKLEAALKLVQGTEKDKKEIEDKIASYENDRKQLISKKKKLDAEVNTARGKLAQAKQTMKRASSLVGVIAAKIEAEERKKNEPKNKTVYAKLGDAKSLHSKYAQAEKAEKKWEESQDRTRVVLSA